MRPSETGGIVDEAGRTVPVAEIVAELTAMKVEQTRLAEKLQNYIAMWKDAEAQVRRLRKAHEGLLNTLAPSKHRWISKVYKNAAAHYAALRGEGEK